MHQYTSASIVIATIFAALNYFSHFYFDANDNAEYNYGLLLPDFVRNFVPKEKYKLNLKANDAISLGAAKHFERDHIFHASQVFEAMQASIKPLVVTAFKTMGMRRYFFVNHILCEMMIDRVLIKENVGKIDEMYRQLNALNPDLTGAWVKNNYPDRLSEFLHRLERFNSLQYLKRYIEDDAMSYSVNRVCMYVGVCNEWTENETLVFKKIIAPIESLIFEKMAALKAEMTNEL